jgi:hypothetical protein
MTNPFIQAHDNIKAQIELARQAERDKLKPVLVEAFAKAPWLTGIWFDTEQRYNDQDYYTPALLDTGFQLFFADNREGDRALDDLCYYYGELDLDRDDVDALWQDYGLTIDELESFELAFKDLFTDVSGDIVDMLFGKDSAWVFNCDGTIQRKDEYEDQLYGS